MITKEQAIALYGSVKSLQTALGLKSHTSVYQWEEIPEVYALRIQFKLRPDAFDDDGNYIGPAPEQGERAEAA